MKKIINVLLIIFTLFAICPMAVQGKTDKGVCCEQCGDGENCHLPRFLFDTFEEWEEYFLSHLDHCIYFDTYYTSKPDFVLDNWEVVPEDCKDYKVMKMGGGITRVYWPISYPFRDEETKQEWWEICLKKQESGEYRMPDEFINDGNRWYWSLRNRPRRTEQTGETVNIESLPELENEDWPPAWEIKAKNRWNTFLKYLGIK